MNGRDRRRRAKKKAEKNAVLVHNVMVDLTAPSSSFIMMPDAPKAMTVAYGKK